MYYKDLTEVFKLRISPDDFNFLKYLSTEREMTVSAVVRSIINDYKIRMENERGQMFYGDTKTDFNNQLQ